MLMFLVVALVVLHILGEGDTSFFLRIIVNVGWFLEFC